MDDRVWNESAAHRVYDKAAWEIHLIEMTRRPKGQVQYINWAGRIRLERADRRQYMEPLNLLRPPENLVTNKPAEPRFELRVDGQVSFKQSNPDGMVSG